MTSFAQITDGIETWDARACVGRHCHDQAYAAVVLSGGYEECGSRGRFRVRPGDVLLHGAFDAHLNRFRPGETRILNILLGPFEYLPLSAGRLDDVDAITALAQRDPAAAGIEVRARLLHAPHPPADWPDMLATDLVKNPRTRLDLWARAHGLATETVSRGFGKVFGMTPAAFRAQARAQAAFVQIIRSRRPLAAIAVATGFSDQAHMTRATRALTGRTPADWRKSNPFKTLGRAAA
jgi:AraC-like DNA-binding protein